MEPPDKATVNFPRAAIEVAEASATYRTAACERLAASGATTAFMAAYDEPVVFTFSPLPPPAAAEEAPGSGSLVVPPVTNLAILGSFLLTSLVFTH